MQESSVLKSFFSTSFPLLLNICPFSFLFLLSILSPLPPTPFSSSFFLYFLSSFAFSFLFSCLISLPPSPSVLLPSLLQLPMIPPPLLLSSLPTLIDNFLFILKNKFTRNASEVILSRVSTSIPLESFLFRGTCSSEWPRRSHCLSAYS